MAAKKRTRGMPRKGEELFTPEIMDVIIAGLSIGGTFREVAALAGMEHPNILHHCNKSPAFYESVQRARSIGAGFRRMMLEDSLHAAVQKLEDDPRYTVLAVFLSKAQLGLSDISEAEQSQNKFREVLAEIVSAKRQRAKLDQDEKKLNYLPGIAKAKEYATSKQKGNSDKA